jgi:succinate dehydrogenase / fumarate reductase cytochrome b subunit
MIHRMATASPVAPPAEPGWLARYAGSSVGGKHLVALTGLALLGFTFVHLLGNLQLYAGLSGPEYGQDAINAYAKFLKDMGPGLWLARAGLLAVFVLHITLVLRLNAKNRTAREVHYHYSATIQATWASRHMVSTGVVVGLFVLFHLAHYTFGVVTPAEVSDGRGHVYAINFLDLRDPHGRHDVYSMAVYGFRNPVVSGIYIACMVALLLHLSHGAGSTFQSLGLNGGRWRKITGGLGLVAAYVIALGNISMPLAVLLGLVEPGQVKLPNGGLSP